VPGVDRYCHRFVLLLLCIGPVMRALGNQQQMKQPCQYVVIVVFAALEFDGLSLLHAHAASVAFPCSSPLASGTLSNASTTCLQAARRSECDGHSVVSLFDGVRRR